MDRYQNSEMFYMLRCYIRCQSNSVLAAQMYSDLNPESRRTGPRTPTKLLIY